MAIVGTGYMGLGLLTLLRLQGAGKVIAVDPPPHVNLKITYTEPAVRGNSSGNITKSATVESGAEVFVPSFIETNETIRIDTSTGKYVERVKV